MTNLDRESDLNIRVRRVMLNPSLKQRWDGREPQGNQARIGNLRQGGESTRKIFGLCGLWGDLSRDAFPWMETSHVPGTVAYG
jgi:hypothetical protein